MLLVDWQIRNLCVWDSNRHDGVERTRESQPPDWKPMIEPFSEAVSGDGVISFGLTSAGYDLRLGKDIYVFKSTYGEHIDPKHFKVPGYLARVSDKITLSERKSFVLPVHGTVLGTSLEYLRIPRNLKARCVGKSTWARCALLVNTTPLEPAWEGFLTIELSNLGPSPIVLYIGEGIAQLEFERLDADPQVSYAEKNAGRPGKYQNQTTVTPPRVL